MFCKNCGNQIGENTKNFCMVCGADLRIEHSSNEYAQQTADEILKNESAQESPVEKSKFKKTINRIFGTKTGYVLAHVILSIVFSASIFGLICLLLSNSNEDVLMAVVITLTIVGAVSFHYTFRKSLRMGGLFKSLFRFNGSDDSMIMANVLVKVGILVFVLAFLVVGYIFIGLVVLPICTGVFISKIILKIVESIRNKNAMNN